MSKLLSKLIIFLILLGIVAGVAYALNPSEADHQAKLVTLREEKVKDATGGGGTLGDLVDMGVEYVKKKALPKMPEMEFHNYHIFSTTKRDGEIVTLGLFGKIFVLDDKIAP
jgi:hypothetical protein